MPLFGWGKSNSIKEKNKTDYKVKTEHKLLQAKQTPEPIFDLADCGLKEVPAGVYSWCKICLKEALLLQDNLLTSLSGGGNLKDLAQLQVLDLHSNELSKLPNEIGQLVNLQVLYLNNNSLSTLPNNFKLLRNLRTLNLNDNKFREFPKIVSELHLLRTLDVSNNNINKLPKELSCVRTLDTLVLDVNGMIYPSVEICAEGTESIMRFLCKENDIDYVPPSKAISVINEIDGSSSNTSPSVEDYNEKLSDYWKQLEIQREKKRQDLLAVERVLQEQQLDQASILAHMQQKKQKLLDDVTKGQSLLEEELMLAQHRKDKAKHDLLAKLVQVEQDSNKVIVELLAMAERCHNVDAIMEVEKRERKEFEELFLKKQVEDTLCRKEVFNAMSEILHNEKILQFQNLMRMEAKKRLQQETDESANLLEHVLDKKSQDQLEIVNKLLNEEQFQKEALIALMNKKDSESILIRDQLSCIHDELTKLTMLELVQQDLKIGVQKEVLNEKREILTQLLIQLLEQQKLRHEEMNRRLQEMEEQKLTSQQDYWLIQYQRMMAHKPASVIQMEAEMDPSVKAFLHKAGVSEYTALFARHKITYVQLLTMGKYELKELGLFNPLVINAILTTMDNIRHEKNPGDISNEDASAATPSAPEITAHAEVECVVCMENQCCMLFLTCGHVCCCENCAEELTSCPMCRGNIVQKFHLRFPG